MRQIAFIGGFDKFDLILYTAIIMANQNKARCLIVDSTNQEKARYIVPTLENENYTRDKYITTFQGVDIAVGFKTREELNEYGVYQASQDEEGNVSYKYDYIFIDLDESRTLDSLMLNENDLIFLTTAFDLYSLNKALRVLDTTSVKLPIHKILFGKKIKNTHITYMESVVGNRNINWGKYNIEFPYENGDWSVIQENQRENRLTLIKLSNKFKSGLKALVKVVTDTSMMDINNTVNRMQKQERRN